MSAPSSTKVNAQQAAIVHRFVHDIKNKIGGVAHLAELFIEQDKETQLEILERIAKNSMDALRTTEVLLEDLGIERNLELKHVKQEDFSKMVVKAINACLPLAAAKHVALKTSITPNIMVNCQKELLIQVPEELIGNAIKFCSNGHVVEVGLVADESTCTLSVKDNGPGLTKEDIANLFQRYIPLRNKPTNGESSSLRGTADAQLIAHAHNTSIIAQSEGKGSGCTFTIALPILKVAPE